MFCLLSYSKPSTDCLLVAGTPVDQTAADDVGQHKNHNGDIKMATTGKPTGKRERIDTTPGQPGGSRYIRRDAEGKFTSDQVDVGKAQSADRRQKAENKAPAGMKNKGD